MGLHRRSEAALGPHHKPNATARKATMRRRTESCMPTVAATPDAIERAAAIIRAGGLVAFPTETVYGLGADATSAQAIAKIFAAQGRPPTNPLILPAGD